MRLQLIRIRVPMFVLLGWWAIGLGVMEAEFKKALACGERAAPEPWSVGFVLAAADFILRAPVWPAPVARHLWAVEIDPNYVQCARMIAPPWRVTKPKEEDA